MLKPTFETVARLHMSAEPERQQAGLRAWAAALCRDKVPEKPRDPRPAGPRVMPRAEAAAVLGRSPRFIDALSRSGVLRKVRMPGRARCIGVRADDLQALVEQSSLAHQSQQNTEGGCNGEG